MPIELQFIAWIFAMIVICSLIYFMEWLIVDKRDFDARHKED